MIYILLTHCLHIAYILLTHCLYIAYTLPTFCLYIVYMLLTHCQPIAYTLPTYCLLIAYILLTYCLHIAYTLPTYCLHIAYTLLTHCLLIAYILLIHCLHVANTLPIYCLHIAYILLTHCHMLLTHCLHIAYIFPTYCLHIAYTLPTHCLHITYIFPIYGLHISHKVAISKHPRTPHLNENEVAFLPFFPDILPNGVHIASVFHVQWFVDTNGNLDLQTVGTVLGGTDAIPLRRFGPHNCGVQQDLGVKVGKWLVVARKDDPVMVYVAGPIQSGGCRNRKNRYPIGLKYLELGSYANRGSKSSNPRLTLPSSLSSSASIPELSVYNLTLTTGNAWEVVKSPWVSQLQQMYW